MKIYISCASKKKKYAMKLANKLESLVGCKITMSWWDIDKREIDYFDIQKMFEAIKQADYMIIMSDCMSYGVAVEAGFAMAHNVPILSSGHISIESYSEMFYLVEHVKGYSNLVQYLIRLKSDLK